MTILEWLHREAERRGERSITDLIITADDFNRMHRECEAYLRGQRGELKTEYQYIHFVNRGIPTGRKMPVWECYNTHHSELLGTVQWDGPWRQYVYEPAGWAIYSRGCLNDVADFIRQLMEQYRASGQDKPTS